MEKIDGLNPLEEEFWRSYIRTLSKGQRPKSPFVEASFAGNREISDQLLNLYLKGDKTAGSSLKKGLIATGQPLPKIDNYWIVLDGQNRPGCILKTIGVVENKFKNVSKEIAQAEGEGDLSLDYWKKAHQLFFKPFLKDWGVEDIEEEIIITEFFERVYPP